MIVKKDDYQPSLAVTEQQVYHRENHSEDQYLHKKEGEETTIRRKGSSLVLLDYQDHYQDHCYHCLCRGNSAFFIRVMMLSILLCLLTLFPIACYSAGGSMRHVEKRILDQIIGEGYDSRIRPSGANSSKETDGPSIVSINIFLRSISKISDLDMEYSTQLTFREEWFDDRLQYDDRDGKIKFLTLTDPEKIWKPDLFFRNEKNGHFHEIIMPNVLLRIYPNGLVLYSIRISLILACPMNLKYYPLDRQTCSMSMASYGYTTEDLVFVWKTVGNPVQVTDDLNLPRFNLQKHKTGSCTSKTNTGEYSCLKVDLLFRRQFSYYLIQIYIPCCMLVIVSWVSFWLDPNATPARVSLGVTTLLTMATQISGINASLPPVSYTKAIDVWTGSCLTFVFGALLEFALVNYASRSDGHRAHAMRQLKELQFQAMNQKQQQLSSTPQQNEGTSCQMNQRHSSLRSMTDRRLRDRVAMRSSARSWDNGLDGIITHVDGSSGDQLVISPCLVDLTTNNASGTCPAHSASFSSHALLKKMSGPTSTATTSLAGNTVDNTTGTIAASMSMASSMASNAGPLIAAPARFSSASGFDSQFSHQPSFSLPMNGGQDDVHSWIPFKKNRTFWPSWLHCQLPIHRSKRIDVFSRIFFPLTFAFFNVVYWLTYLGRDDLEDLK